jgi:hypothetical protein
MFTGAGARAGTITVTVLAALARPLLFTARTETVCLPGFALNVAKRTHVFAFAWSTEQVSRFVPRGALIVTAIGES